MRVNLQKLNVPPLSVILLVYLLSAGIWFGSYFIYQYPHPMSTKAGFIAEGIIPSTSLIAHIITFAIVIANSFILSLMNRKFSFIRTRTFIPSIIYLLLASTWLQMHGNYIGAAASFFILLSLFLSLEMYKNKRSFEHAFLASLLFSMACLLVPNYLFIIPVFFIGFFILKAISFRIFLASVFGFITPWIFYFSISFFFLDSANPTDDVVSFISDFKLLNYQNIPALVYIAILSSILVISAFQIINNSMKDSIQARNQLSFIFLLGYAIVVLTILRFNHYTSFSFVIIILFAIQIAYPLALIKNKLNPILFFVLLFFSLVFALSTILIGLLNQ